MVHWQNQPVKISSCVYKSPWRGIWGPKPSPDTTRPPPNVLKAYDEVLAPTCLRWSPLPKGSSPKHMGYVDAAKPEWDLRTKLQMTGSLCTTKRNNLQSLWSSVNWLLSRASLPCAWLRTTRHLSGPLSNCTGWWDLRVEAGCSRKCSTHSNGKRPCETQSELDPADARHMDALTAMPCRSSGMHTLPNVSPPLPYSRWAGLGMEAFQGTQVALNGVQSLRWCVLQGLGRKCCCPPPTLPCAGSDLPMCACHMNS